MIYSERMAVRLGQFPLLTTDLPQGGNADLAELGLDHPDDAAYLLTVNWAVDATQDRGLPEEPHRVLIGETPTKENGGCRHVPDSRTLKSANSHRYHIDGLLGAGHRPWGVLCTGFVARANKPGTELHACAMDGTEIGGTRRRLKDQDVTCVLVGPNIFELRADGDVTISDLFVFTATPDMFAAGPGLVARVAPTFEPEDKPDPWPYDDQAYLGIQGLQPKHALHLRQLADSLARGNTNPPSAAVLDREVHRRSPSDMSDAVAALGPVTAAAEDLLQVLRAPQRTYEVDGSTLDISSGTDRLSLTYAQILQLIARQGPVEALTLGNAVTLPILDKYELGKPVEDEAGAYQAMRSGRMPFPLILVTGRYHDAALQDFVDEFGIGGLDMLRSGEVKPKSAQIGMFDPEARDGPATATIRTRLSANSASLMQFVSRISRTGDEEFDREIESKLLNGRLPYAADGDERNLTGLPEIGLGRTALPLEAEADLQLQLYPRDMFGRWPDCEAAPCHLLPRPVGVPALHSCQLIYGADGMIAALIVMEWDRKIRSLKNVELGLAITNRQAADAIRPIAPADGLACPAFAAGTRLLMEFDLAGDPTNGAQLPRGVRVERILRLPRPAAAAKPKADAAEDSLLYEITVPLGQVTEIMALRVNQAAALQVELVADAAEHVSGTRRSSAPLPRLASEILDPRPPVLEVSPWKIAWTGLPNGETNQARISLALPRAVGGPAAEAYQIWRAPETAVLRLVLARHFEDIADADRYLAAVRRESNMAVRLGLIQRLIEPRLKDPSFATDLSIVFRADSTARIAAGEGFAEIIVTAQQSGFEFVWFTAVSRDGVQSDKIADPCLRVVAVPKAPIPQAPTLRLITSDDDGHLEIAGLCLALVSYHRDFDAGLTRFFWDHGDLITDASELLFELEALSELTVAEASTYVADIEQFIEENLPFEHTRIYVLMPNRSAERHHFAVEFKGAPLSTHAPDQIPSPRSQLESVYLKAD